MKNSIFAFVVFFLLFSSCSDYASSADSNTSSTESYAWAGGDDMSQKLAFNDQSASDDYTEMEEDESQKSNNDQPIPGGEGKDKNVSIPTKIIKEGNIGIRVDDFKKARTSLDGLMKKYKAYVGDENERKSHYEIQSTIIIRIPAENFDAFMNEVGDIASKVNHKRISAKDVTKQYVDIQSRLKLKKEVRDKYESFLKNAKNVEEMLAIEREVRILTEEIEAKEAELRYLSDKVGRSTITLDITQKLKYEYVDPDYAEPSFFQRVGKGFSSGWDGLLAFFVGLTYLWPLILIGIILFLAIRKPTRRFLKRLFGNK